MSLCVDVGWIVPSIQALQQTSLSFLPLPMTSGDAKEQAGGRLHYNQADVVDVGVSVRAVTLRASDHR